MIKSVVIKRSNVVEFIAGYKNGKRKASMKYIPSKGASTVATTSERWLDDGTTIGITNHPIDLSSKAPFMDRFRGEFDM